MIHIGARLHGKTWEYYFEGPKINGKRNKIHKSGFTTKEQAIEAGQCKLNEYIENGQFFKLSDISFIEFLNTWYEDDLKIGRKRSTLDYYMRLIQKNVKPIFRKYKLKSLTSTLLQNFFNEKTREGLEIGHLYILHFLLKKALDYAVATKLILSNPMKNIQIKYSKSTEPVQPMEKERKVLSPEIIDKIFKRFHETTPTYLPMMLAYKIGARPRECFAFIWDDINFENKIITIRRYVFWDEQAKVWTFKFINNSSFRSVSIDEDFSKLLMREKERKAIGQKNIPSYIRYFINDSGQLNTEGVGNEIDLVTVRMDGSYVHPRALQHTSSVIHKELKCIDFDLYSLCYTYDNKDKQS
ncbi:MAG: site-specific integrase [Roseburia sp.]|nr:site-specific integrase [Roseburia sp.]